MARHIIISGVTALSVVAAFPAAADEHDLSTLMGRHVLQELEDRGSLAGAPSFARDTVTICAQHSQAVSEMANRFQETGQVQSLLSLAQQAPAAAQEVRTRVATMMVDRLIAQGQEAVANIVRDLEAEVLFACYEGALRAAQDVQQPDLVAQPRAETASPEVMPPVAEPFAPTPSPEGESAPVVAEPVRPPEPPLMAEPAARPPSRVVDPSLRPGLRPAPRVAEAAPRAEPEAETAQPELPPPVVEPDPAPLAPEVETAQPEPLRSVAGPPTLSPQAEPAPALSESPPEPAPPLAEPSPRPPEAETIPPLVEPPVPQPDATLEVETARSEPPAPLSPEPEVGAAQPEPPPPMTQPPVPQSEPETVPDVAEPARQPPDAETASPVAQPQASQPEPEAATAQPEGEPELLPWGVILTAQSSREAAERQAGRIAGLIPGEQISYVQMRVPGQSDLRHVGQVGRTSRGEAEELCARLKAQGAVCMVLRN